MKLEFIIGLTQHRFLGYVLAPYLIQNSGSFYTIDTLVKMHGIKTYQYRFLPHELELVRLIEKYSDEKLARKFSRSANVSEFYNNLKQDYFLKQVTPYIEKVIFSCAGILMREDVRVFKKDAKYANLYDEDIIKVNRSFAQVVFHFERNSEGTRYRLQTFQDGKELSLLNKNVIVVTTNPCILAYQGQLFIFNGIDAKKLTPFFSKEYVSISKAVEDKYYNSFVLNMVRRHKVVANGFKVIENNTTKQACLTLEPDLQYEPSLVLRFNYDNEEFLPNSARKVAVKLEKEGGDYVFYKVQRDTEWEHSIISFLESIGLEENNGYYTPKGVKLLERVNALYSLINWLSDNKSKLLGKGVGVSQANLDKKYFTDKQELRIELNNKVSDWFDIYAVVHFGEYEIPFIKLKKYILNDIREFELPNGETAILPEEWFSRYKEFIRFGKAFGKYLKFSKYHFPILKNRVKGFDRNFIRGFEEINNLNNTKVSIPDNVKAKLRAYQEEGVSWMFQLHKNDFGGCLADDMGLGKTLQTLTLLLKLKRAKRGIGTNSTNSSGQLSMFEAEEGEEGGIQPASLIVVPTSLIHNWENEVKKFTPSLKVFKYVGAKRKKVDGLGKIINYYDIILTTYGTVRNDLELLAGFRFFYLILDESQNIKNPSSKIYKAVKSLKAGHRLVLTGTPIENSLIDLWSQVNFLNDGLLGNLAFFRQYYITPIERHNDPAVQEKLQLMIRPFILRRTKEQVAKDLPPLMEQVRYCSMADGQLRIYEREKSIIRNAVLENIEKEGLGKSSFVVLQGLTKLRQLANHPSMVEKGIEHDSGKFDEIYKSLQNLMAEKHKVLIFSSFVKHLELIRKKIEEEGWMYSMLTGQTTNRGEVIRQFQETPENRIFLISLKAGGVGLNLTEADYVFIIDPWWNPAAENQAVNRAHRMGQDKHVFVYRFITENSIEEKIQQLKERKSTLADKFINSNNPFKSISKEEIMGLLE